MSDELESITAALPAEAPGNLTDERWFWLVSRATPAEWAGGLTKLRDI